MIKLLRTSFAAFAAFAVIGGAASAQSNALSSSKAPVANPSELLASLDAESIAPVLEEMGLKYQGATMPDGQKVLLAQAENGIKFQLTPTACDKGGKTCRGLSMVALFQSSASSRAISAFDQHYVFVSAGMNDGGVAYLTRYDLADYGLPKGNLAVSLMNYLHMASIFDRHLYESVNTVKAAPSDSDLSAEGLNMQAILANSSLADAVGISSASHRVSFETLPEVVDTLVRADSLAPGRLINRVKGER